METITKLYPEMDDNEREVMWSSVADYLALPEDERNPKTNKEVYEALQIPERTFYDKLRQEEFMRLVVKKSLIQAKKFIPRVLAILQKNVEEGKEKSIEMFIKYVGEVADKIDHTTKGEKIQTTVSDDLFSKALSIYANNRQTDQRAESSSPEESIQ